MEKNILDDHVCLVLHTLPQSLLCTLHITANPFPKTIFELLNCFSASEAL